MIDSSNAFGVRERIEQLHLSNDELAIKGKPRPAPLKATPTPTPTLSPTPSPTPTQTIFAPSPTPSPTPTQTPLLFPYSLQGPGNPVEDIVQKMTLTTATTDIIMYGPYDGFNAQYTSMSIYVNGEFRSVVSFTKDRINQPYGYGYVGATAPQAYGVFVDGGNSFLTIN